MAAADLSSFTGFNSGFSTSPKGRFVPLSLGDTFSAPMLLWLRLVFFVQRVSDTGTFTAILGQGPSIVTPAWSLGDAVSTGVTVRSVRHYLWRVETGTPVGSLGTVSNPTISYVSPMQAHVLGYRRGVGAAAVRARGKLLPQLADLPTNSRDFFRV